MHLLVSNLGWTFRLVLHLYLQNSTHCTQKACSNFTLNYALVSSSFLDRQSSFLPLKLILLAASHISTVSIKLMTYLALETSFIILASLIVVSILAHLTLEVLTSYLIFQQMENTLCRSEASKLS